jgi:uncharacterized protein (UPF0332 family)
MRPVKDAVERFIGESKLTNIGVDIPLAQGHFAMAYHNLRVMDVLHLFENSPPGKWETCPDWVITTGYYAMYHSALALLALKGWKSDAHDATIAMLEYAYVYQDGKLTRAQVIKIEKANELWKATETLKEAKMYRKDASYGVDLAVLGGSVKFIFDNAKPFVDKMYRLAEEMLGYELVSRT